MDLPREADLAGPRGPAPIRHLFAWPRRRPGRGQGAELPVLLGFDPGTDPDDDLGPGQRLDVVVVTFGEGPRVRGPVPTTRSVDGRAGPGVAASGAEQHQAVP